MSTVERDQRAEAFAASVKKGRLTKEKIKVNLLGWVEAGMLTYSEMADILTRVDTYLNK